MKITRSNIIIAVMALIIAILSWALVFYGRDEFALVSKRQSEKIPTKSAVGKKEGFATVSLSKESQAASGIASSELVEVESQGSTRIYGSVMNPQALFDARAQYLAALAEVRTQRVTIAHSENEYQRLKRLFADDRNVSERALQQAQVQWAGERAKLAAAEQNVTALKDNLRANWGDTLTAWAADPGAKVFRALSTQRQVLVQLSVPPELREQIAERVIHVGPLGGSENMRVAHYVTPAPRSDGALTGATFIFLADAADLRQGMRISGRVELEGESREGVLIPPAAVVWHAGKAWCYIQEEPDEFVRKEVSTQEEIDGGWFNAKGFEAGDKVVIRGAQLLLSEEQKFQIREENDD